MRRKETATLTVTVANEGWRADMENGFTVSQGRRWKETTMTEKASANEWGRARADMENGFTEEDIGKLQKSRKRKGREAARHLESPFDAKMMMKTKKKKKKEKKENDEGSGKMKQTQTKEGSSEDELPLKIQKPEKRGFPSEDELAEKMKKPEKSGFPLEDELAGKNRQNPSQNGLPGRMKMTKQKEGPSEDELPVKIKKPKKSRFPLEDELAARNRQNPSQNGLPGRMKKAKQKECSSFKDKAASEDELPAKTKKPEKGEFLSENEFIAKNRRNPLENELSRRMKKPQKKEESVEDNVMSEDELAAKIKKSKKSKCPSEDELTVKNSQSSSGNGFSRRRKKAKRKDDSFGDRAMSEDEVTMKTKKSEFLSEDELTAKSRQNPSENELSRKMKKPKKKRKKEGSLEEDSAENGFGDGQRVQEEERINMHLALRSSDEGLGLRKGEEEQHSPTVTIAVAGSVINNCQTLQLATILAGQIARAATIFRVDEVVVFDDDNDVNHEKRNWQIEIDEKSGGSFLARILEYLETPQYLRQVLFPMHQSLRFAGTLPPLDAPHHLRRYEWKPYREGVTKNKGADFGCGSYVDIGLYQDFQIEQSLSPGKRVTVFLGSTPSKNEGLLKVVERTEPRQKQRLYWGYSVRHARSLSAVFKDCPYEDGYDHCLGTSEHGDKISSCDLVIPKFKHLLITFGGVAGLEESLELDPSLKVDNVSKLFHRYLNVCPNQGSRTIRTEEAIFISLQYFQHSIQRALAELS